MKRKPFTYPFRQSHKHWLDEKAAYRRGFFLAIAVHIAGLTALGAAYGGAASPPREVVMYEIDLQFPPPEAIGMPKPAAEGPRQDEHTEKPPAPEPSDDEEAAEEPKPKPEKKPEPKKEPEKPKEAPKPKEPTPAEKKPEAKKPEAKKPEAKTPNAAPKAEPQKKETPKPASDPGTKDDGKKAGTKSGNEKREGKPNGGNSAEGEGRVATGNIPRPGPIQGEGINVHADGLKHLDGAYLNNVVRQIYRFFRKPADTKDDRAEVVFWLHKDGSVSGIEVVKHQASFAFRMAAIEAVEQPGARKLFGPMPESFPNDKIQITFTFAPEQ